MTTQTTKLTAIVLTGKSVPVFAVLTFVGAAAIAGGVTYGVIKLRQSWKATEDKKDPIK